MDSACVIRISRAKSATSARMATTIIQDVPFVSATFTVRNPKFVTKCLENVCVKMDMARLVAIAAYLDSSTIRNACLAIAQQSVPFHTSATSTENVHVCKTLLENAVSSAWPDSTTTLSVFHVIAILTDPVAFPVTTKDNVIAKVTLMIEPVTAVRRTTIISHCARVVTVIQLVLLLNLLAVDRFQWENFVSVRNAFRAEFAINVDHFTGT